MKNRSALNTCVTKFNFVGINKCPSVVGKRNTGKNAKVVELMDQIDLS